MELVGANAVGRVLPEISPARNAELAARLVAHGREAMRMYIQLLDRAHDAQHVDHWLGDDPRDRRAPDMMQHDRQLRQRTGNDGCLALELRRPGSPVRHEGNATVRPVSHGIACVYHDVHDGGGAWGVRAAPMRRAIRWATL